MSQKQINNSQQSFYSIQNSKNQFTLLHDSLDLPFTYPLNLNLHLKQQSANAQLQCSNELNQPMKVDLSMIRQLAPNDVLELSMFLQRQIDCLTLPNEVSAKELEQISSKINKLKEDQLFLKQQLNTFQHMMKITQSTNQNIIKQITQTTQLTPKHTKHPSLISNEPSPSPVSIKLIQKHPISSSSSAKHYDIKPNKHQTASQIKANNTYKDASFTKTLALSDAKNPQYQIKATYQPHKITITICNLQQGTTNYLYGLRINDNTEQAERVSQKLVYSLAEYRAKTFTVPVSVMLIVFEQGRSKENANVKHMEEIRTFTVPLPLCCFVEQRLKDVSINTLQQLKKHLFVYEIEINYNADLQCLQKINKFPWIKHQWFSLRGTSTLLWLSLSHPLALGNSSPKQTNNNALTFRIGGKHRDSQPLLDMIEYLCFMLSE